MKNSSSAATAAAVPRSGGRNAKPRTAKPTAAAASPRNGEERDACIRRMAYAFYEARGCTDGLALEDWLKAQARYDAESTAAPAH